MATHYRVEKVQKFRESLLYRLGVLKMLPKNKVIEARMDEIFATLKHLDLEFNLKEE